MSQKTQAGELRSYLSEFQCLSLLTELKIPLRDGDRQARGASAFPPAIYISPRTATHDWYGRVSLASQLVAIRPRSLFASAAPVAITLALLALKEGSLRVVTRVDALCALAIAVLVQTTANLNASYSNFHRAFNPMQAPKTKDNKIVIKCVMRFLLTLVFSSNSHLSNPTSILSDKILRMWSWLFMALILTLIAVAQFTGRRKKLQVAGFSTALAIVSFLYCRRTKPLAAVGVQELVFGLAYGPIAMASTALVVVGSVPIGVVLYSVAVLCFAVAFQVQYWIPMFPDFISSHCTFL
jgi:1,4-dihydroxy-2-naphthoate octaprenyltransferase